MIDLNFTNSTFVLYQILPNYKKIEFLYNSLEIGIDTTQVAIQVYQNHFKDVISPVGKTEIGIVAYTTDSNDKVNMFFQNDEMHINCNKLLPIKDIICTSMTNGIILIRDHSFKKTSANKDRYHLRYYRVYRRINYNDALLPMCLS